jgi:Uma2 family endonuclease
MGRGPGKMELVRESVKYNYADLENFPDDGKRREIIDGELYVTPSPVTPHQIVVGNLYFLIRRYLEERPVGRAFLAPLDVVFSQFDVVEPDLLFVSTGRAAVVTSKNIAGSPDLAIEVLSPGTRRTDETIKRRLYERFDVLEYWVVDSKSQTIKIHRRAAAGVPFRPALATDHRVESPIFPDLTIDLSAVFEGLPERTSRQE